MFEEATIYNTGWPDAITRRRKLYRRHKYSILRKQFLKENQIDLVSLFVFGKFQESTCVHHSRGRKRNLNDINSFIATTKSGDDWIHKNSDKAKELGFIA